LHGARRGIDFQRFMSCHVSGGLPERLWSASVRPLGGAAQRSAAQRSAAEGVGWQEGS
jgi:hypothetical protein